MITSLLRLTRDTSAQDLAEYGIALAIIAVAAGAAAVLVAGEVGTLWTNAQTVVQAAI